jgi:hypothetical protein
VSGRKGEWGGEAPGEGLLPAIAAIAGSGLGAVRVEWVLVGLG